MIKTLIAGGDSWTDPEACGHEWPVWPKVLEQLGEFDEHINVARAGGSNSYIFNSIIDAIHKYENNDITVVVLWSLPLRINLFDVVNRQIVSEYALMDSLESHYHKTNGIEELSIFSQMVMDYCSLEIGDDDAKKMFKMIINNSLRYMCMFENYCKLKNIKYYHGTIFDVLGGMEYYRLLRRSFTIDDDLGSYNECFEDLGEYYYQLEKSKHFMGYDFDFSSFVFQNNLTVDEQTMHPNEEGHNAMAKIIYNFMTDGIRSTNEKFEKPVHIYD